jgi:hypothetical protein
VEKYITYSQLCDFFAQQPNLKKKNHRNNKQNVLAKAKDTSLMILNDKINCQFS